MTKSEKCWRKFAAEFTKVCVEHGGQHHPKGIIYEKNDASFQIPTQLGLLNASIHWDGEPIRKLSGSYIEGIYLRFETYTGPKSFPFHGDFNDYSHKWNIHQASNNLGFTFYLCLRELNTRLDLLTKISKTVVK